MNNVREVKIIICKDCEHKDYCVNFGQFDEKNKDACQVANNPEVGGIVKRNYRCAEDEKHCKIIKDYNCKDCKHWERSCIGSHESEYGYCDLTTEDNTGYIDNTCLQESSAFREDFGCKFWERKE